MKFAVLLSSADAFFSPMKQFTDTDDLTQTSFFTDLIEAFQNTADDDYYYYEDEGDDYESPATSVFKQVAASLLDFNPALRSAAKGKDEQSGCSIEQMSKKNALATLNCPNVKNGHVKEGTPCSWQCNNGYVYGNKGTNRLKCESGGAWNGIKKVKCNAGCAWPALRRLQANGEFAHCQDETQFGLARFKCRVERDDRDSFDYRGARCVCKDSRRNSGKCEWKLF
jgi:hypothetical protein